MRKKGDRQRGNVQDYGRKAAVAVMVGRWGPLGGEGAVEHSTQFTQTALSARGEALHRQTKGEEGAREGELVREAEREEGMEMYGGAEDEW